MRIGEFSKHSGESIDTLRYYEKLGLLKPQRINGQRLYGENELKIISIIQKLKKLSFKLAEIKMILELDCEVDEGIDKGQLQMVTINKCLALFQNNLQLIEIKEKEIKEIKEIFFSLIEKIMILKNTMETG